MESQSTAEFKRAAENTARSVGNDLKETVYNVSQSVSKAANSAAHDIKEKGEELYSQAKDTSAVQLTYLEDHIRKNPLRAIAISAAAGFVLSRVLRQS